MKTSTSRRGQAIVAFVAAGMFLAACGSDGNGGPSPEGTDGVVSGELRTFTYSDTVHESKMVNFHKNYPDVEVRTATFESNDEAAAKIKAGFRADVIEVCLDEQGPLVDAGMLAPIDTSRLEHWDDLDPTFRDAAGVAAIDGQVSMVPTQAGAVGLIYDKDAFPDGVDSWADLFDPANAGRVALDGGYWLPPFAIKALADGSTDPMNLDDEQVTQIKDELIELRDAGHFRAFARSDADMGNMFKSGEIVLSDGGRATADDIIKGGGNVAWAAPKEGALSWVCGLSISSQAENLDAAYALINEHSSPETQALFGNNGFVMINPEAVPLVEPEFAESSDPRIIEGAYPEVAPANADLWRKSWQEVRAG
ncbi:PotD/PotF family extracellular solute-binding protein [Nocardioides bigeumensis]|uniref:ABC transporter substrate-binding protein n=1 Tax=Nocardioides bigeumensis TaxID=433657 RepID=A0ABP5KMG9_9ACTN